MLQYIAYMQCCNYSGGAVRATRLQIERLHSFHSRFTLFDDIILINIVNIIVINIIIVIIITGVVTNILDVRSTPCGH